MSNHKPRHDNLPRNGRHKSNYSSSHHRQENKRKQTHSKYHRLLTHKSGTHIQTGLPISQSRLSGEDYSFRVGDGYIVSTKESLLLDICGKNKFLVFPSSENECPRIINNGLADFVSHDNGNSWFVKEGTVYDIEEVFPSHPQYHLIAPLTARYFGL
jgi:hypothetical protein